jgi:signal transduction histidine kinase
MAICTMPEKLFLPRLSPLQIISAGSFTGLLLIIYVIWLAVQQPWLGIQIQYAAGKSTLKITDVVKDSPAYNKLEAGDEILGFQYGEQYIAVTPLYNIEDPDSNPTYALYNEFMRKQTELYNLFINDSLIIKLKNKNVTIFPQANRPLSSLSLASFWMVIILGFSALIIVLSIWSTQRGKTYIRILALLGGGFFIGAIFNAVTLSREVVLHGELFHLLSSLNLLGIILFGLSITALLWNFPKQLSNYPTTLFIYILYPVIWVNQTWQIIELPLHAYYLHFLITFIFLVFFAIRQWFQSRDSLVEQAALQWLLLSITLSLGVTIAFFYIPTIYSTQAILPISGAYFAAFMIFIGFIMGIIKHNLFNLSRIWLEIWVWIISGSLVLLIDLALVYLLDLASGYAFVLSAIIVGWIYFPARQWFLIHVLKLKPRTIEQYFPVLIEHLIANNTSSIFSEKWVNVLNEVYSPISINTIDKKCEGIKIENNGINLITPSFDNEKTLVLSYRDNGKKLFDSQDKKLCQSLYDLTIHTLNIKKAQEHGAHNERKRIARDLHDDTAAQILTMIHSTDNESIIKKAQKVLKSLRETIYSLDTKATVDAQTLLENLYSIAEERINLAGLTLQWDVITISDSTVLNPRQHINLQHILQEAISNIIKNANASKVSVFIVINSDSLDMKIYDNGKCGDINTWIAGKGLNNIKTRVKEINGIVNWYQINLDNSTFEQGCCIQMSFNF